MRKFTFCTNYLFLDKQPISFADRPYLQALYDVTEKDLVVRASRQVEKSTFLTNTILYEAVMNPGSQILFVSPRLEQARVFSNARLLPALEGSPVIRQALLGKSKRRPQIMGMRFNNGSQLFIRAAYHSADAARGISADLLLIDEFQDIAAGDLPVLQETLSHSTRGQTILTGTPKLIDNHLEAVFRQSTANEWIVTCTECQTGVILDERCLGVSHPICPSCTMPIDPRRGHWVARNPHAKWEGFWVNHLMVPWMLFDDILSRQHSYDLARFKNEVLGLPTALGDHVVTREEVEACCSAQRMATVASDVPSAAKPQLVAGIDWGGGSNSRTVLVLGYMRSDYVFVVCRLEHFLPQEHPQQVLDAVSKRLLQFGVRHIAADGGGNGHVLNRLLVDRLRQQTALYAILYSTVDHELRQDGLLWKWTVNRSGSLGAVFSRVKKKTIAFPRVEDCGSYLDEIACELAEYDDAQRTICYTHPETQPDDALHALNYALLIAIRQHHCRQGYGLQ